MNARDGWRLSKVSQEQRVALHEVLLRGAARNYSDALDTRDEEAAAAKLREAAIEYATTLLQRAGSEASPRARGPEPHKDDKKEGSR